MKITSSAFSHGDDIPEKYTLDGENISPPLRISAIPAGTESLVLIMEDIDSPIGPFTHWVVWNLASDTAEIAENSLPTGAQVGLSGFGELRYGGPCPPSGRHRYVFRLFALDTVLETTSPDRRDTVESEMEGNVIAKATLKGFYQAKP